VEDANVTIAVTQNPLTELRRASSVAPWIALLGRKVFAVPATSRLTCDHLEKLMYVHERFS